MNILVDNCSRCNKAFSTTLKEDMKQASILGARFCYDCIYYFLKLAKEIDLCP